MCTYSVGSMFPMATVIVCLCFITIIVHSKIITVNNSGNNSTTCCMEGTCLCNSFHDALRSIENNTIINITSEFVSLEDTTYVGIEHLNNVTLTGNNVVVMCNNTGGMSWRSGDNILIEGITWNQCGDPRYPSTPAFKFNNIYNISIVKCTFQHSKVCITVFLLSAEEKDVSVYVVNSSFMFNKVENASICFGNRGSIVIQDYDDPFPDVSTKNAEIIISGSIFSSNGNQGQARRNKILVGVLFCFLQSPLTLKILIEHSNFTTNGILGVYLYDNAISSYILFNNLTIFNNSQGGVEIASIKSFLVLDIKLAKFFQNNGRALVFSGMGSNKTLNFQENLFARNKGSHDSQGAALYIKAGGSTMISVYHCSFDHNIAFGSIVYIAGHGISFALGFDVVVSVSSSKFLNNQLGSALYVSQVILTFDNFILFQNNSAETGAAMYIDQNAFVTVTDEVLIEFVNNSASLRGGAIYSDLSNCFNKGLLFSNLSNYTSVKFTDNTATISGNSIYFN